MKTIKVEEGFISIEINYRDINIGGCNEWKWIKKLAMLLLTYRSKIVLESKLKIFESGIAVSQSCKSRVGISVYELNIETLPEILKIKHVHSL